MKKETSQVANELIKPWIPISTMSA